VLFLQGPVSYSCIGLVSHIGAPLLVQEMVSALESQWRLWCDFIVGFGAGVVKEEFATCPN
jgi:hypothetical protein